MRTATLSLLILLSPLSLRAEEVPAAWQQEFPLTDFSRHEVPYAEIKSGGPPRDGIPSIDAPRFQTVAEAEELADNAPVISLVVEGEAKAYPLEILIWHEIVNDEIAGRPVLVTYCPLCNAALVFERTLDGTLLEFGTTGRLRHSDLVMYDRQTESWWQQFEGRGIVGVHSGRQLAILPSRIEGFARFAERHPDGLVLERPEGFSRRYGTNPYAAYDSSGPYRQFFQPEELPGGIPAMAYVVAVGEEAWSLSLLRTEGPIESGELLLSWSAGAASALDHVEIARGRDVGNVVVQRRTADGTLVDVPYDLTFAFVFHAFRPEGVIHQ